MDGRAVIIYDEDCGFCRWALDKLLAWDRVGRLRPVALQDAEADELLGPMDAQTRMASWHLVTGGGRVYSAGAAVAPLARMLPAGAPIALLAGALPGPIEGLYRVAARNRDRLGRLVGADACAVDPKRRVRPTKEA